MFYWPKNEFVAKKKMFVAEKNVCCKFQFSNFLFCKNQEIDNVSLNQEKNIFRLHSFVQSIWSIEILFCMNKKKLLLWLKTAKSSFDLYI